MEVWFWLAFILVILPYTIITYNQLVSKAEQSNGLNSNVKSHLTRKANLYEKMASIMVLGTSFEEGILKEITTIRESNSIEIEEKSDRFRGIIARVESNPDIKSISMLREMQQDAEITENLLQESKESYNIAVANYNELIRQFPSVIVAILFNFKRIEYIHKDIR